MCIRDRIKTADELSRIEATEESLAEHRRLAAHITALRIPAALQRRLAGISEATSSTAAPSGMLLDHSKGVALLTIGRLATERELVSLLGVAANALTALGAQLRCVLFSVFLKVGSSSSAISTVAAVVEL